MKTLFRFVMLIAVLGGFCSCEEDHSYTDDTPNKIVYSQVAGTWQLTQWNNSEIRDGLYFYVILHSKGHTFEIYQNFDSGKSRRLTGIYTLEYDENEGNTITGLYDHASGFWNHIYRIDRFTEESMTWIVKDDLSDISVYTRCEAVPDDILNGTRAAL